MNFKKIIALLLLVSCFSLASCNNNSGGDNSNVGGEQSGNQQENSGDTNQDVEDENPPADNTPDDDNEDDENKDDENKDDENQTPEKFIPDPITYEEYEALSPDEKLAYFESFTDYNDFYAWFNKAKEEYDASHKPPEIGDNGEIDIGGN